MAADPGPAAAKVRTILTRVLEKPSAEIASLPDSTPLFGAGLSLDSITGLELLLAVKQEFGVDIAAEDLNLDSLETLGTLVGYLVAHSDSSQTSL